MHVQSISIKAKVMRLIPNEMVAKREIVGGYINCLMVEAR